MIADNVIVGMLASILLLFLTVHFAYAQEEKVIRLVNGATDNQGRVEVFVKGEWGTVCDDSFGISDATVICKMLGYPRAKNARGRAYYGEGRGQIWVDQLACTGEEDSIFDCKMNKLGEHNCKHREDAGVECFRPTPAPVASLPVRLACPCNQTCKNVPKRCSPDQCLPSIEVEGIVEVYFNGEWLRISADNWGPAAVHVVCGQLGYPQGFGTISVSEQACGRCDHKVTMKDLDCSLGTESELKSCHHKGWGPFDNPSCNVATVRCGFVPHETCGGRCPRNPSLPRYRLRAGPVPWMGRAEVLYNKKWGTVCDVGFNEKSANVLCRSLGYGTAEYIKVRSTFGRGIGEIWLNQLKCEGNELWLHQCDHLGWGEDRNCRSHSGDVGVKCRVPSKCTCDGNHKEEQVRLISGPDIRNPDRRNTYVEINAGTALGGYGLLCADDIDIEMGHVLCRCAKPDPKFLRLFFSAKNVEYRGQRYRGKFVCNGTELSINECRMAVYAVSTCSKGDLAIECDIALPDLVPSLSRLEASLRRYPYTDITPIFYLKCAREENCLASGAQNLSDSALRTLLRFDSLTMNYGLREFSPFLEINEWIWHACHNHFHSFEVFVTYDLFSFNGTKVAEGHKASFCLEDSICDSGGFPQRRCGSGIQGISRNCGDLYARHLDCQWIDITGVPDGVYTVVVDINPSQLVFESDYRNNVLRCNILLSGEGRIIQVISCSQSDHEAPVCSAN